jgi:hypothetical protein
VQGANGMVWGQATVNWLANVIDCYRALLQHMRCHLALFSLDMTSSWPRPTAAAGFDVVCGLRQFLIEQISA